MGESLDYRYFKNVDDMLDYAYRDLDNFGNFEFEVDNSIFRIEDGEEIKKINKFEFICNEVLLNSRKVEPCT
jgi:hypothetical protein